MNIRFFLTLFCVVALFLCAFGQGKVNPNYHQVNGYFRKDHTYVKEHKKTNPNSTNTDNYSTQGNTNPWTGQAGWVLPDNKQSEGYGVSSWELNSVTTNIQMPSPTLSWSNSSDYSSFAKSETSTIFHPTTFITNTDAYPVSDKTSRNTFYSAGTKTIYYKDGKEVFDVLATSKTKFKKNLTYYFYDPELDKVMSLEGGAYGQLLDGRYRMVLDNGILLYESNFKQGLYDGYHIEYDMQGNEKLKITYKEGVIVKYKAFNDKNELVEWHGTPFTSNSVRTFKKNEIINCREEYKNESNCKIITYNEENGKIINEFNYENGVPSGNFKFYYDDGRTIKRIGYISDSKLHGEIKDFAENGKIISLTTYTNGIKNGRYEFYSSEGNLLEKGTFKNDLLDGFIEFNSYNESVVSENIYYSSGKRDGTYEKRKGSDLLVKGAFSKDEPHGRWEYFLKDEESKKNYVAAYFTFENGIKSGNFKEIRSDSILIGVFKNGKVDGRIKIYRPLAIWLLGIIPQDVQETDLIAEGEMNDGRKVGAWKFYDVAHSLTKEGQYQDDEMYGTWKYYYPKYVDINGSEVKEFESSGKLYLIENYLNGMLNGKSERYSYLEKMQIMCDTSIGTVNPLDTCYKMSWVKRHELIYYKNNVCHGPIEFSDSLGIIVKGNFINGKKNDLWIYRQDNEMFSTGYYSDDKKNGTWKTIARGDKIMDKALYKNGQRDGFSTQYDYLGNKLNQAIFNKGKIQNVIKFDTLNHQQIEEFKEIKYLDKECSFIHTYSRSDTVFSYSIKMQSLFSDEETDQRFFLSDFEHAPKCLNGQFTLTNPKGQTLISGNYLNGIKTGDFNYFNYQQKVKRTITFENDKRKNDFFRTIPSDEPFSGVFKTFSEDKTVRAKIKVRKGLRHGKTIVFDKSGRIEKIKKYKKGILVDGVED